MRKWLMMASVLAMFVLRACREHATGAAGSKTRACLGGARGAEPGRGRHAGQGGGGNLPQVRGQRQGQGQGKRALVGSEPGRCAPGGSFLKGGRELSGEPHNTDLAGRGRG